MDAMPEKRTGARFYKDSPIMIEYDTANYCSAMMYNYSDGGMYFEVDRVLEPGEEIYIGIENSPYSFRPAVFRAEVRWCREIGDEEALYFYGVGVRYNRPYNN